MTRIVLFCYKKEEYYAGISITLIVDETSNVFAEFAAGRSSEFANVCCGVYTRDTTVKSVTGGRSSEFAGGTQTSVEHSNVAYGVCTRGAKGVSGGGEGGSSNS